MGILTKKKKQQIVGALPKRSHDVLKVVHPKHVDVFNEPITAAEIMRRYPRHCIARPDVFEYPWIVVRPESVLVPGKVFYLVPYHTMHNLLKAKTPPPQYSSNINQSSSELYHHFYKTSENKHKGRYTGRPTPYHHSTTNNYVNDHEYSCDQSGQDSDDGSFYKSSFYESLNEMRRNLQKAYQEESYDVDSPVDDGRSCRCSMMSPGREHVESPERFEWHGIKSCLRKSNSERKKMHLSVRFMAPVRA